MSKLVCLQTETFVFNIYIYKTFYNCIGTTDSTSRCGIHSPQMIP